MAGSTPAVATGLAINGYRINVISIKPLVKYTYVDPNPYLMAGILDDAIEFITPGIQHHGWRVLLSPHPAELDVLIPLIGYTESPTDTFTPTDTLTTFTTLVRLKSNTANVWTTSDCVIDKAVFRGQKGMNPVSLQLDILGKTSTPDGSTFSPTTITRDKPYPFTSGTLTLASMATAFDAFVLVHDNHIRKRFNNSVTADVLTNVRRTIHLGVNTPYTDDEDGLLTTFTGSSRADGIAANLNFTNSNKRLIWDFTKVLWQAEPPAILGKEAEVRMYQYYQAVKSGSNVLCTITQDATA